MGYFNRDSNNRNGRDNRGGGRGFGRGRDSGRRNDGPREMFKTTCSSCGKECEVPFRPTTGKPVYCSDCFEKVGGRDSGDRRPERRNDRPQDPRIDNSKQLDELNRKLDKIIELLTPKIEEVIVEKIELPKVKKVKK